MEKKVVYSTRYSADMPLIKSILQANEIDFDVRGEWSGGVFLSGAGIEIMVIETQVEKAKALIEDFKKKTM